MPRPRSTSYAVRATGQNLITMSVTVNPVQGKN